MSGTGSANSAQSMDPSQIHGNGAFGSSLAKAAFGEATEDGKVHDGHHCYTGVANALDKVGVQVSGMGANEAAPQLANNPHFHEIKCERSKLPSLPAGTVVVWDKNEAAGHRYGHISVAMGNGKEASDVMRNQSTNYDSTFRVFVPADDMGSKQGQAHPNRNNAA